MPDFYDARALDRRFPAVKSLTASITKALKVSLDPITMDTDLDALLNLLRTHDANMPYYLDMPPEVRTTLLAEGGAPAEWLQATDLAVANGVYASLDKDSTTSRTSTANTARTGRSAAAAELSSLTSRTCSTSSLASRYSRRSGRCAT